MDDTVAWLEAEHEYQVHKVMGALADAMMAQDTPMIVPGPTLKSMAERAVSTGVRHGTDWVSIDDAAVVPQWVTKGMEDRKLAEVPPIVSEGALPEEGVAKAVSWAELSL
jgi:hypothetical protein